MELKLMRDEIICFDEDLRESFVCCLSGCLWVTQPNDSRDHLLKAGTRSEVTSKGRIVVMALAESRITMEPAKQKTAHRLTLHTPATPTA